MSVSARLGVLCALSCVLGPACRFPAFACDDDAQCNEGFQGVCVPDQGCAYSDDACASNQRFGPHSGGSLAGQCVPVDPSGSSSSMGPMTTDVLPSSTGTAATRAETTIGTTQSVTTAVATTEGIDTESMPALDCSNETLWICESFEDGESDVNLEPWSSRGGVAVAEAGTSYTGQKALHVAVVGGQGARGAYRVVPGSDVLPPSDSQIFGRLFLYASPSSLQGTATVLSAIGPVEGLTDNGQYRLDIEDGQLLSRLWYPELVDEEAFKKRGYVLQANTWTCVEWHYDGIGGEMRFWFDGSIDDTMTVLSTDDPPWPAPTFNAFFFGWQGFSNENADLRIDDVALGSERIGCE